MSIVPFSFFSIFSFFLFFLFLFFSFFLFFPFSLFSFILYLWSPPSCVVVFLSSTSMAPVGLLRLHCAASSLHRATSSSTAPSDLRPPSAPSR
jgi:hypothetical protein